MEVYRLLMAVLQAPGLLHLNKRPPLATRWRVMPIKIMPPQRGFFIPSSIKPLPHTMVLLYLARKSPMASPREVGNPRIELLACPSKLYVAPRPGGGGSDRAKFKKQRPGVMGRVLVGHLACGEFQGLIILEGVFSTH